MPIVDTLPTTSSQYSNNVKSFEIFIYDFCCNHLNSPYKPSMSYQPIITHRKLATRTKLSPHPKTTSTLFLLLFPHPSSTHQDVNPIPFQNGPHNRSKSRHRPRHCYIPSPSPRTAQCHARSQDRGSVKDAERTVSSKGRVFRCGFGGFVGMFVCCLSI